MALKSNTRRADNVRIGPVSIITLIAVICMAVLAVLAVSTAHATMTISERQADATKELYRNEYAAQEFVAGVDDVLAQARAGKGGAAAGYENVKAQLDALCEQARTAAGGEVEVTAEMDAGTITASFVGARMRQLDIALTLLDDGTLRIDRWKAAAVQQEAQPAGNLWSGA